MPKITQLEDGRVATQWSLDEARALDRARRQQFDALIRARLAPRTLRQRLARAVAKFFGINRRIPTPERL